MTDLFGNQPPAESTARKPLADRPAFVIKGRIVFAAASGETIAHPPPALKTLLEVRRHQRVCGE